MNEVSGEYNIKKKEKKRENKMWTGKRKKDWETVVG